MDTECTVDMQIEAHIPENYIESTHLRLDVYRKIADIKSFDDSLEVIDELIDRFGEPPEAVKGLIDIAMLRNIASGLKIKEVKQINTNLLLYADTFDMQRVSRLIQGMKGRVLVNAGSKPYISIKLNFQPPLTVLENALKLLTGEEQ